MYLYGSMGPPLNLGGGGGDGRLSNQSHLSRSRSHSLSRLRLGDRERGRGGGGGGRRPPPPRPVGTESLLLSVAIHKSKISNTTIILQIMHCSYYVTYPFLTP